jgi:hypothetical protein
LPCPYHHHRWGEAVGGGTLTFTEAVAPNGALVGRAGKAIGDKIVVIGQPITRLPCPYHHHRWGEAVGGGTLTFTEAVAPNRLALFAVGG